VNLIAQAERTARLKSVLDDPEGSAKELARLREEIASLKRQRVEFADDVAFIAGMIQTQSMGRAAERLHKKMRDAIANSQ